MVMNPRTHPRGAPADFTLPRPNPNPARMTDALWWLVCMRELLEPASENGGTYADKPGYHNYGDNLPSSDHSIRWEYDRTGPWWRTKCSAHDWTFPDAQRGDYRTINKYTKRQINAMRDPDDLRPDQVYAYILGNVDGDVAVEGWNERTDAPETSSDRTHAWHIHDSIRRSAVGSYAAMWKILTIDMGWTYAEYLQSLNTQEDDDMNSAEMTAWANSTAGRAALKEAVVDALEARRPYFLQRIGELGWSNLSVDGKLDYLLESVLATAEVDDDHDASTPKVSASLQARLNRVADDTAELKEALAEIKALLLQA